MKIPNRLQSVAFVAAMAVAVPAVLTAQHPRKRRWS
jgi:hypothetical protein